MAAKYASTMKLILPVRALLHQAIKQVQAYVKDGYAFAVDIDLAKFFDTVNHDVLMKILAQRLRPTDGTERWMGCH